MSKKKSMWKVYAKVNNIGSDNMTCIADDIEEAAKKAEAHFHEAYGDRDHFFVIKIEHLGTED